VQDVAIQDYASAIGVKHHLKRSGVAGQIAQAGGSDRIQLEPSHLHMRDNFNLVALVD
jgi:hypothetical protein